MGKILVIAEKPSQGRDYARILGAAEQHVGYMEGERYVVTWTAGHSIGLKEPEDYDEKYRRWTVEDLPLVFDREDCLKVLPGKEKLFRTIKQQIRRTDIDLLVNGGDAGREGEVIQRWIYRVAGNRHPVKRLWISSLDDVAIRRGFADLQDESLFDNLYEEGVARAQLDQFLGFNYSRALTLLKTDGLTITYGRCQTPVLNEIYRRDTEIENFVPKAFYTIKARFSFAGGEVTARLIGKDGKRAEYAVQTDADQVLGNLTPGTPSSVSRITKEHRDVRAPLLYNLTKLQKLMNRKYGYSAQKTLDLAQSLYEKKILSYPRTDAQYISTTIEGEIVRHLAAVSFGPFKDAVEAVIEPYESGEKPFPKAYVNDAKIEDHHAIIPTLNPQIASVYQTLTADEKNVFDAVTRSFIAVFYPPFGYDTETVLMTSAGLPFLVRGRSVTAEGWRAVTRDLPDEEKKEKEAEDEAPLPPLAEGETGQLVKAEREDQATKPKPRYTEASLLAMMEKTGIGTSATRASIIGELFRVRGHNPEPYVKKEKGKLITSAYARKFLPFIPDNLKSVEFVAQVDKELKEIEAGKKTRAALIHEAVTELETNIAALKADQGPKLMSGRASLYRELGTCPHCGQTIMRGPTHFYCTGYKAGCQVGGFRERCGAEITDEEFLRMLSGETIEKDMERGGIRWRQKICCDKETGRILYPADEKDTGWTCPVCGKPVVETPLGYACLGRRDKSCNVYLSKTICGRKMTREETEALFRNGKSPRLTGFRSKKGTDFDAVLFVDKEKKEIGMKASPATAPTKWVCPVCGKPLLRTKYQYGSCAFRMYATSFEKDLTDDQVGRMLELVKTGQVAGGAEAYETETDKETDLSCPLCGKPLARHGMKFSCACGFSFYRMLYGYTLTDSEIRDILTQGKTGRIDGFMGRDRKPYAGCVIVSRKKKTLAVSQEGHASEYKCPCCGKPLQETYAKMTCTCGFSAWNIVKQDGKSVPMPDAEKRALYTEGHTGYIVTGKSAKGRWSARVVLDPDNKSTKLEFKDSGHIYAGKGKHASENRYRRK